VQRFRVPVYSAVLRRAVLHGRDTAKQWIKKDKNAVKWMKLSCRAFKGNQARLQLFALAYNLANFLRRLAVPTSVSDWSLTTLREKLIEIGAKVTRHSKYVAFQLAEVAVPRELFASLLERIKPLAMPPPSVVGAYASAEGLKTNWRLGQASHGKRRKPLFARRQVHDMRFSISGKWQPDTENPRGR
jgi:hypothetical protein